MKPLLFLSIVLVVIMIPVAYAYTDPVSLTLIWQFLASVFVGILFFFRQIKFWLIKKFKKNNDTDNTKDITKDITKK